MNLPSQRCWKLVAYLYAVAICVIGAEVTARVDDYVFSDTPILANPDREHDLVTYDELGPRGRPNGIFEHWRLNSFGFRSPEMKREPNGVRVILLGASEAFGLYESPGHDIATVLQGRLRSEGRNDIEVINAAMAGMALPAMRSYWNRWVKQFRPSVVVIYPSPTFYLDQSSPRLWTSSAPPAPVGMRSRMLDRLVRIAARNDTLRGLRARFAIWKYTRDHEGLALFDREIPRDRLVQFSDDLKSLAEDIQNSGATPVLLVPPFRAADPPRPQDYGELSNFRIFYPRATPEALTDFNYACQQAVHDLAGKAGWTFVDAASVMNGHRDLFADPVHPNDAGSAIIASLVSAAISGSRSNLRDANTNAIQ